MPELTIVLLKLLRLVTREHVGQCSNVFPVCIIISLERWRSKSQLGLNSETVVLKNRDFRYFTDKGQLLIRAIHRFYR